MVIEPPFNWLVDSWPSHCVTFIEVKKQLCFLPNGSYIIFLKLSILVSGFPDCLGFSDFRRQFEVLRTTAFEAVEGESGDAVFDEREVNST